MNSISYCDCRQGRDPCTCNRYASAARTHCNNLKGIYGADMYAPAAVQVLRTENATLRRRVKAYAAVSLLGWAAVVVMGVAL